MSVAYIGPKLRRERPRKTKIGTEVAHVTRDSDTTFKVKRSKVKVTGGGAYCGGSHTACYAPAPIGGGIKRCYCLTSVCLTSVAYIMNIHGAHSCWKQGALGAPGVRRVWAGARLQRTAYRGGGISCGLAHSLLQTLLLSDFAEPSLYSRVINKSTRLFAVLDHSVFIQAVGVRPPRYAPVPARRALRPSSSSYTPYAWPAAPSVPCSQSLWAP